MKFLFKKPITVFLFYVAVLMIGLGSLYNLPVELIPEADFPKITIHISWPFTSSRVIESQVVSPLEGEIQRIPGIHKISSTSRTGSGLIRLELNREVDVDFFTFELQQYISLLKDRLPSQYIRISVQKYIPEDYQSEEFMSFSMTGEMPSQEITRIFHEKVLPQLLSVKGVSHVTLPMQQYPQLLIKVDRKKCEQYGIPFQEITRYIYENDLTKYLGAIQIQDQQFFLIFKNRLSNSLELKDILLEAHKGRLIRLHDVAEVVDTVTTLRYITRINGENSLLIRIQKESGANSLTVADNVIRTIQQLERKLDSKIHFIKESDQSEIIRKNLRNLWFRSSVSLLVIFCVLLFFLSDIRSPFVIISSILFSLLLTFIIFYLMGYTLNLFSLAGLALGFGILVDNSIVVLEAIFHHWENGEGKLKSILKSEKSVKLPVIASSATTIVALIPIIFLTGELKLYYFSFVRAVIISLLSSIVVAFTLIPLTAFVLLPSKAAGSPNSSNGKTEKSSLLSWIYQKWLGWSIQHRKWIVILCVLWFGLPVWKLPERLEEKEFPRKNTIEHVIYNDILVPVYNFLFDHEAIRKIKPIAEKVLGGTSYWFFKHVEIGEIWRWNPETGYVGVAIGMPDGTDPRFTIQLMQQFEEQALSEKGVSKVKTNIWPGGGFMRVEFTREAAKSFIPYMVKEKLIQLATNFAGFRVSVWGYGMGFSSGFGSGTISNYLLELKGYNYQALERIARKIKNLLRKHRRVRNVNIHASGSYFNPGATEEIVLEVKRQELGRYGIRVDQLLNTVRHYLQQENWFQKITIGENEFIFNMKEKNSNQFSIDDLKNTILTLSDGSKIRIRNVANIVSRKVEPEILRENQEYIRYISFDFIGPAKYGKRYLESFLKSTVLPPGYSLKEKKLFPLNEKKDMKNILFIIFLSILLIYMVTAALFESVKQPFLVLFAIPMALTGVFLAFYLTGINFDQSAMIGVILLAGIVVNNSILLIYHVDELQQKLSTVDSIISGTLHRARPILMTTLTTVLGMLPLILLSREISQNSDLWSSLALSSIGGLITSTVFVLMAMPAILSFFYRKHPIASKDN